MTIFRILEQELQPYKAILSKAADAVMNQEVSDYPIFVVHQQEVSMGIPLVDKDKSKGNWSVNVSSLEEFVTKQIVDNNKVDDFRKTYKVFSFSKTAEALEEVKEDNLYWGVVAKFSTLVFSAK